MRVILIGVIILLLLLILVLVRRSGRSIELRKSPVHGRGIFACTSFEPGDTVEVAPLINFQSRDELSPVSNIRDYDIRRDDGRYAIMLGYASIYNHSDKNNAEWHFQGEDELIVKAIKPIKEGDEIFVSYGEDYWKARPDKI
jgi:SET domain-containing protein